MAELNRQKSAQGKSQREVARDWLAQKGFITKGS
jgi:glycine betaine/choline ABC-type transport system substrate-binding protein